MTHQQQTVKINIIDVIRENFTIVTAIIAIIGSWVFFQFQVTDHEKRISVIETQVVKQVDDMSDIKGDIKEINAKLDLLLSNKIK